MPSLQAKSEGMEDAAAIGGRAEELFRTRRMNCAEAALSALGERFRPDLPAEVCRVAAGFGGGSGSGCICGAVAGATMAMGLLLAHDRKRLTSLTRELHAWFTATYGAACCRVITAERKGICATLTGRVAARAAELLADPRQAE